MIGLVPFVVGATGWASMYLNAAARGTEEAWRGFTEANAGTVVGYGMTVTFLPLLAQPALLAMIAAELVFLGVVAWVASIAERRFDLDRRLKDAIGALIRKLPYREAINRLLLPPAIRAKMVRTLRTLIPMLEHKTLERPYRSVLLYVALPTLCLVVATFSVLTLLAAANPGEPWILPVLQSASTAIGYAGATSGVVVLASLGVPLVDPKPFPRVTDWKGVLAAAAMLYACTVFSVALSIVA